MLCITVYHNTESYLQDEEEAYKLNRKGIKTRKGRDYFKVRLSRCRIRMGSESSYGNPPHLLLTRMTAVVSQIQAAYSEQIASEGKACICTL